MKILTFPLGQMRANCYVITNENNECIIIDPAEEANFILEEVQRRNLHVKALFATHGHFDHIMAVGEIQLSLPVPFYISNKDIFLLKRVKETAKYFLGYEPYVVPPKKIQDLKIGAVSIGGFEFEVISTPGHTPGSVCLYSKNESIVFTGDTLFQGSIGRYDFSYSDKEELRHSLERIIKLPEETTIYPGHGDETSVAAEQAILEMYPL